MTRRHRKYHLVAESNKNYHRKVHESVLTNCSPMALTELDRNLIKRCLTRQPGAWKDFVDRFLGLFIHVVNHSYHAHSIRATPEDVDDLCSEIFLEILASDMKVLQTFRGKSSLATYLTIIARRITLNEIMRKRRAESLGHTNVHNDSLEQANAVTHELRRIDDREEVAMLMAQLSDEHAEVLRLYHLEGKSYREIAQATGLPENTVGSILSRGREKLRDGNLRV